MERSNWNMGGMVAICPLVCPMCGMISMVADVRKRRTSKHVDRKETEGSADAGLFAPLYVSQVSNHPPMGKRRSISR